MRQITLKMEDKDVKLLRYLAEKDRRPLSNYCRIVLEDHLLEVRQTRKDLPKD